MFYVYHTHSICNSFIRNYIYIYIYIVWDQQKQLTADHSINIVPETPMLPLITPIGKLTQKNYFLQ